MSILSKVIWRFTVISINILTSSFKKKKKKTLLTNGTFQQWRRPWRVIERSSKLSITEVLRRDSINWMIQKRFCHRYRIEVGLSNFQGPFLFLDTLLSSYDLQLMCWICSLHSFWIVFGWTTSMFCSELIPALSLVLGSNFYPGVHLIPRGSRVWPLVVEGKMA